MFNLLDTPGHEDFSEDTYRTLTAADAAVMVLDAAKGIEPQTLKLFEVCRLRDIPIVTFINKMDREAQDPFDLLDEIAVQAGARSRRRSTGRPARAAASRACSTCAARRFLPYARKSADRRGGPSRAGGAELQRHGPLPRPRRAGRAGGGRPCWSQEASKPFDPQSFLEGHMTPVFFGSALRHFGVDRAAGRPRRLSPRRRKPVKAAQGRRRDPRRARRRRRSPASCSRSRRTWTPTTATASPSLRLTLGQVPARHEAEGAEHRPPAVASTPRSCSSPPTASWPRRPSPATSSASPTTACCGWATACRRAATLRFAGLPNFAPEILRRVRVKDPLKAKHLKKALEGLAEEGVTQLFRPQTRRGLHRRRRRPAAVRGHGRPAGQRIRAGRASSSPRPTPRPAGWSGDKADVEDFVGKHRTAMADDIDGQPGVPGQVRLGDRLRRRALPQGDLRCGRASGPDVFPARTNRRRAGFGPSRCQGAAACPIKTSTPSSSAPARRG